MCMNTLITGLTLMNEARLFKILSKTFEGIKHVKVISKTDAPSKRAIIKVVMSDDSKYLVDYLISTNGKQLYNCYQYIGNLRGSLE